MILAFDDMVKQLTSSVIIEVDNGLVDDVMWYTVTVTSDVAAWIRNQPRCCWYQHPGRGFKDMFDIHEHLYTASRLKFT